MALDHDDLASCLRAWRDRLSPAEIGLPASRSRRAPGLRREELAHLAGLSVDYLARLEQGRATNPSPSVLAPLARALRLTDQERDHLYRVAGQAAPCQGVINRHITPGVQRIMDRLADVPVMVVDPASTVVARNALAIALFGDDPWDDGPHPNNHAWRVFMHGPGRVRRTEEEQARVERAIVADLHIAAGCFTNDTYLHRLIRDLRTESPRFAELWDARPAAIRAEDRKTIVHPEVGPITLDCDHLAIAGSDLHLVVNTVPPGSPDAEALAFVAAVGLQQF